MPTPLPVLKIISSAFVFLWEKKRRVARALLIPVIIISSFFTLQRFFPFNIGSFEFPLLIGIALFLILAMISLMPYVLFSVTCHRLLLIENTGVPEYGMLTWTRREWWFLAYLILLPLVYSLVNMFFVPLTFGLIKEFQNNINEYQAVFGEIDFNQGLTYLINTTATYIFARFSLIYPATAIDRDIDVDWAWKISKGNGWRLLIVVGVLPLALKFLAGHILREEPTFGEQIVFVFISLVLLAVEIVALSLSYKHLTENEIIGAEEEDATV